MSRALPRLPALVMSVALFAACFYLAVVHKLVPLRHVAFTLCTAVYAVIANVYVRRMFPALVPPAPAPAPAPVSSVPTPSSSPSPIQTTNSSSPSSSSSSPTSHQQHQQQPPSISPVRKSVRLLFPFTLMFSLFAPVFILYSAHNLHGLNPSTSQLHALITPSLFLVMAQILCETLAFVSAPFFTIYIRFVVTTAFVSYRLSVLLQWYDDTPKWAASQEAAGLPPSLVALVRATALINIVFWGFALLCFLLLYCSPELIVESGGVEGDDDEYYCYYVDDNDDDVDSNNDNRCHRKIEKQQEQGQEQGQEQEQQQQRERERVVEDHQCNGTIVPEQKNAAEITICGSSSTSSPRLQQRLQQQQKQQQKQQVQGGVKLKST